MSPHPESQLPPGWVNRRCLPTNASLKFLASQDLDDKSSVLKSSLINTRERGCIFHLTLFCWFMDHCIHWYAVVHGWFLLPTPKFHFLAAPSSPPVSSHVTVSESNLSSLSLLGPFWTFFSSSAFRCRIPNSSTSFFPLHQSQEFAIERHMAGSSSAVLIIRSLSKFAKLPTRPISTSNTYSHLSNGCTSHHFLFHSTEN